ncbi:putative CAMK family protein kinase [Paratrimastix pyriformis]|uniref:CAMK family protein kinase n=1 Tax=Paratrimastix pyriformis TaxID=342808 RepID=A0ABQ8UMN0_9EUKA|nr:putative CAMK family protein kinase [Paratrimastix pyriformis]
MPRLSGYRILRFVAEGLTGKVFLAERKADGLVVAIKRLKLDSFDDSLRNEVQIMHQLGAHPNTIQLYDTIESNQRLYIVMEYADHGELFSYLAGGLRQDLAAALFRQIVEGLFHLHKKGIAHRDLKPENILLSGASFQVKITDFGFSTDSPGARRSIRGSPLYAAPEIFLSSGYDARKADLWSLGIILTLMLTGTPVLETATPDDPFFQKICARQLTYEPWTTVLARPEYQSARDLCLKLLVADPSARLTIDEVRRHPWVEGAPLDTPLSPDPLAAYMREQLQLMESDEMKACSSWSVAGSEAPSSSAGAFVMATTSPTLSIETTLSPPPSASPFPVLSPIALYPTAPIASPPPTIASPATPGGRNQPTPLLQSGANQGEGIDDSLSDLDSLAEGDSADDDDDALSTVQPPQPSHPPPPPPPPPTSNERKALPARLLGSVQVLSPALSLNSSHGPARQPAPAAARRPRTPPVPSRAAPLSPTGTTVPTIHSKLVSLEASALRNRTLATQTLPVFGAPDPSSSSSFPSGLAGPSAELAQAAAAPALADDGAATSLGAAVTTASLEEESEADIQPCDGAEVDEWLDASRDSGTAPSSTEGPLGRGDCSMPILWGDAATAAEVPQSPPAAAPGLPLLPPSVLRFARSSSILLSLANLVGSPAVWLHALAEALSPTFMVTLRAAGPRPSLLVRTCATPRAARKPRCSRLHMPSPLSLARSHTCGGGGLRLELFRHPVTGQPVGLASRVGEARLHFARVLAHLQAALKALHIAGPTATAGQTQQQEPFPPGAGEAMELSDVGVQVRTRTLLHETAASASTPALPRLASGHLLLSPPTTPTAPSPPPFLSFPSPARATPPPRARPPFLARPPLAPSRPFGFLRPDD